MHENKVDAGLSCKPDDLSCEHPDLAIHVQQDHVAIFGPESRHWES